MYRRHLSAIVAVILFAIISNGVDSAGGPWIRPKDKTPSTPKPTVAELETTSTLTTPFSETKTPSTPFSETTTTLEKIAETTTTERISVKETTTQAPVVTTVEATSPPIKTETKPVPKRTRRPKPIPTLPPVDFKCGKKTDGYYADPKDKCSSIYYACVGGQARKMECGSGDLVYDPETSACERRHDSFRCTGTRKTTKATTPRAPPPPPPPKLLIDCTNLDDGWYADPTKKCSHIFFSCSNYLGSQFECPGRMYFDAETKRCSPYQDVFACSGKRPAKTKKPETTVTPRPKEKLPVDCADKPSGQYPDPTKKCSRIYYVCSNGDGFKRECPGETFYDVKKKLCDYFDDVWMCSYKTKSPTTVSTKAPVPSVASLPSTEFDCKGKPDRSYTLESKKCSHHYYRCVGGVAYKAFCPRTLYYDTENDLCDRWDNLFVCSGKYPTTPLPTESTKAPVTEKLPIDCAAYDDGDFPDPEKKCSSIYYSCSGRIGQRRQCPSPTYYDKDLGICDTHGNVPDCSDKPRTSTAKPPQQRPIIVTKSPYDCEKLKDGNYRFGKCEPKYWSCVGGASSLSSCPPGTFYDTEMDECGYKEEIPSCGGVRRATTIGAKEEP